MKMKRGALLILLDPFKPIGTNECDKENSEYIDRGE
jgi:hypothetical protein